MSGKKDIKNPAKATIRHEIEPFVFKKENYILLIASVLTIVIGFIVMGSGGKDAAFDDPIKITVAPIIVLAGFALGVVSIMYTPKNKDTDDTIKQI